MISRSSSLASSTRRRLLNVIFFCCIEEQPGAAFSKLRALLPPVCIWRSSQTNTPISSSGENWINSRASSGRCCSEGYTNFVGIQCLEHFRIVGRHVQVELVVLVIAIVAVGFTVVHNRYISNVALGYLVRKVRPANSWSLALVPHPGSFSREQHHQEQNDPQTTVLNVEFISTPNFPPRPNVGR